MKSKLVNELDNVLTKEDFSKFIISMIADFKDHSDDWENQDLPSFLKAVSGWVEDMDGFYENQGKEFPGDINWKIFADIFYAARIYE
ncbi:hypothetical protein [Photobacterium sp. 1_MG-2023]|uniref:DUF7660 family protein n=1 Tax=Photobacterium sp. 1_MG-2023 TaxID=3062646 RepID=UPI0026E412B5|nr:hypothetical protein [Photobacterium sp. 1_MG-2023]MDO6708987.1 hypothetical protein [Photobacterium sp. 1_MG-2023]